MNNKEIIEVINKFIDLVENQNLKIEDDNKYLMMLLDSLGLAIANCKYVFDKKDYPDPPKVECDKIRTIVGERFRDYGYYNLPENIEKDIYTAKIVVGDAIDDISDIYRELKEVSWRWKNTSSDDALWCFENNYKCHWGQHLRNLQRYIFNKQF